MRPARALVRDRRRAADPLPAPEPDLTGDRLHPRRFPAV